jgi:hypothetical protein
MHARAWRVVFGALLSLAAGCASHRPAAPPVESIEQRCELLYQTLDQATLRAGRADAGAARVPGYPYLRTDRFTVSLKNRAEDGAAFDAWVERMRGLDLAARGYEWANLEQSDQERLTARLPQLREGVSSAVQECGRSLARRDFADVRARTYLRRMLRVRDDYDVWKRAVGIYALTRIPFSSGVRRYQAQTLEVFGQDLAQLPMHGQLVLYAPGSSMQASATQVHEILSHARPDALGVPTLEPPELDRLFDAFAPVYWIDAVDDNDRIGELRLEPRGRAAVDTAQPIVYRRLAYTRYGAQIWLQLVYSVWLPARPRTGAFDLLGGNLDGITWRVTLDGDGVPVLYDSIHNCGCYHQFFPTRHVAVKPQPDTLDETAFVPQRVEGIKPGERIWLRIATRTHYIERVLLAQDPTASTSYAFAYDDALRSVPIPGEGSRSVFRGDGIVAGSERGERWLFWPMGVREPGAMRQWGHHATAFIGRRHFDDADLIERYFERVP